MKSKKEIREVLKLLEEANKLYEGKGEVAVCITCKKILERVEDIDVHLIGYEHVATYTDVEHDGIGEWIKALKWVLGEEIK